MGITHFLCYGSLWGQLRLGRTLPWERDIELCVLNEEMALKDEVICPIQAILLVNDLVLLYCAFHVHLSQRGLREASLLLAHCVRRVVGVSACNKAVFECFHGG